MRIGLDGGRWSEAGPLGDGRWSGDVRRRPEEQVGAGGAERDPAAAGGEGAGHGRRSCSLRRNSRGRRLREGHGGRDREELAIKGGR